MKTKTVRVEVVIPKLGGTGEAERVPVKVPVQWDEELQEWLLTPEAHERIEATKARYLGLLLPEEIKALRQRLGLTQTEICELLQIGEKTWSRWENGRERPSRVLNVLLCALQDGKLDLPYLRRLAAQRQNWAAILTQFGILPGSPWLKTVQGTLVGPWKPVHSAQTTGSADRQQELFTVPLLKQHGLPLRELTNPSSPRPDWQQPLKNVISFQLGESGRSAAAQASPREASAGTPPTDELTLAA